MVILKFINKVLRTTGLILSIFLSRRTNKRYNVVLLFVINRLMVFLVNKKINCFLEGFHLY